MTLVLHGMIQGFFFGGFELKKYAPAELKYATTNLNVRSNHSVESGINETLGVNEKVIVYDTLVNNFRLILNQDSTARGWAHDDYLSNTPLSKERVKQIEAEKAVQAKVNARKSKIKSSFSSWDGSHINLVRELKRQMNDPDSFEHVSTVYRDLEPKDELVVTMKFRGNNAFGGKILSTVIAVVDLDGNVLSMDEL